MANFDFVPFSTQYEPKNALLLAKAAQLAYYHDEDYVQRQLTGWGLPESYHFDHKETQGFVATNDEAIILAFRGTEVPQLRDWMTDLRTWLDPGPQGEVHSGFQKALHDVWDEVWSQIQIYQGQKQDGAIITGSGKSLWITGHSLGAGLATLAAAKLRLEMDEGVFGLYTFGSPRVGDRVFAEAFNAAFGKYAFRFVNDNDVVSRIPLRKMRYSHVGRLIYIDSQGDLHDDIGWWWRFLERIKAGIEDYLDDDKVPKAYLDHDIRDYIAALENNQTWRPG